MRVRVRVMVFNATFNNISFILWQSVLLVEKTTDLSQAIDRSTWRKPVTNFITSIEFLVIAFNERKPVQHVTH
jgi:hypothetical protein